jgi:hypothetical protein
LDGSATNGETVVSDISIDAVLSHTIQTTVAGSLSDGGS